MKEQRDEQQVPLTDEEKAFREENNSPTREELDRLDARDMPAGTIITQPYFSDIQTWIVLK